MSTKSDIVQKLNCIEYPVISWPPLSDRTPPNVLFVSGFKRTGKDTFARDLSANTFSHNWDVYTDGGTVNPSPFLKFAQFRGAPIVAFADQLRTIVYSTLDISSSYDYEENKDVELDSEGVYKLRDALIHVGSCGRAHDLALWAKRALIPHFAPCGTPAKYVICSDHRFRSEYQQSLDAGITALSVRIFRREVPIPLTDIESEHDLDSFKTNILLVGGDKYSFNMACALWPQYGTYKKVLTLGK